MEKKDEKIFTFLVEIKEATTAIEKFKGYLKPPADPKKMLDCIKNGLAKLKTACDNYAKSGIKGAISKSTPYLKEISKRVSKLMVSLNKIGKKYDEKTTQKISAELSKNLNQVIESILEARKFNKRPVRSSHVPMLSEEDVKKELYDLYIILTNLRYDNPLSKVLETIPVIEDPKISDVKQKKFESDLNKIIADFSNINKTLKAQPYSKLDVNEFKRLCGTITSACDEHIKKGLKGIISKSTSYLKDISKNAKKLTATDIGKEGKKLSDHLKPLIESIEKAIDFNKKSLRSSHSPLLTYETVNTALKKLHDELIKLTNIVDNKPTGNTKVM